MRIKSVLLTILLLAIPFLSIAEDANFCEKKS